MAGFVYVMTNAAFPHLVKLGKSAKDPRQDRVNELNHTGVPQPFRVEYYAFVEDEGGIERWLHSHFDSNRPNKAREFFHIGVAEAIMAVRDAARLRGGIKYEEVFYVSQKELEERRRKQEQARLREEQQRAEQRAVDERRRQEQERVAIEERQRRELARQEDEKRLNALQRKSSINGFMSALLIGSGAISFIVATAFPIFWVIAIGLFIYGFYLETKSY